MEADTAEGENAIAKDPQGTDDDQMVVGVEENSSGDDEQPPIETWNLDTISPEVLLVILDYMDSDSLMELCDVNEYFDGIVRMYKHVFRLKMFRIEEYELIRPIYTNFGKFIGRLDLCLLSGTLALPRGYKHRFNDTLQLIMDHFEPNSLVDLSLSIGRVLVNKGLLHRALPFMNNLEQFKIYLGINGYSRRMELLVDDIIGNFFYYSLFQYKSQVSVYSFL